MNAGWRRHRAVDGAAHGRLAVPASRERLASRCPRCPQVLPGGSPARWLSFCRSPAPHVEGPSRGFGRRRPDPIPRCTTEGAERGGDCPHRGPRPGSSGNPLRGLVRGKKIVGQGLGSGQMRDVQGWERACRDRNRRAGIGIGVQGWGPAALDRHADRGCDSASGQRRQGEARKPPRRIYGGLARAQEPLAPQCAAALPVETFFASLVNRKWGPAPPAPGWRRGDLRLRGAKRK